MQDVISMIVKLWGCICVSVGGVCGIKGQAGPSLRLCYQSITRFHWEKYKTETSDHIQSLLAVIVVVQPRYCMYLSVRCLLCCVILPDTCCVQFWARSSSSMLNFFPMYCFLFHMYITYTWMSCIIICNSIDFCIHHHFYFVMYSCPFFSTPQIWQFLVTYK